MIRKKILLPIFKYSHPVVVKLFKNTFIQRSPLTTLIYKKIIEFIVDDEPSRITKITFRNLNYSIRSDDITILPSLITGQYEKKELDWFSGRIIDKLPSKITFLDIGANVGLYSLVASNLIKHNGVVKAIEPAIENLKILKSNIIENKQNIGKIDVFEIAIGNYIGTAKLSVEEFGGLNHLTDKNENSRVVQIQTLNSFNLSEYESNSHIVVKIDVEGFESEVLEGGLEFIQKFKPDLIIEILPKATNLSVQILENLMSLYTSGVFYYGNSEVKRCEFSQKFFRDNTKYGNLVLFI
jgi:FkbM family methyltransferase